MALIHTAVETIFWFHPLVWWPALSEQSYKEDRTAAAIRAFGTCPEHVSLNGAALAAGSDERNVL